MFWADEIAEQIIERRPDKELYRVHDYKTPSGRIHVGSLRGVVIHSIVERAIKARGKVAEYTYGFDDYDPMDGFPVYLPESFRGFMGKPLSEIPSPEPDFASFGRYFAEEFIKVFNKLGIQPNVVWSSEMYKSGQYNEAIRISLDKADLIRRIYKETSGSEKPADWYALSVLCPNCGRIGTTRVFAWDGDEVSFRCEKTMVKWAEGCGYEGKISPFDGNAKLPWKVEWAAKWFIYANDFETAGKDHMTKGGSFDVSSQIVKQVYEQDGPIGREYPYEFLLVGGKKMSSSKALGTAASDILRLLPPHLLNFFIGRGKLNRQLNFEPAGSTMPLLYDEYDKALTAYLSEPASDEAKVISYTKTDNQIIPEYTMRFTKVAFLSQMPNIDIWQVAEQEKGEPLTPDDKNELTQRIEYTKTWLADFAPEEMRFELQDALPATTLTDKQKQFLQNIRDFMVSGTPTGPVVHEKIHALKTELALEPAEAFGLIYHIFLGKHSGPQAGWFLAALDKDFVIKRFEQAIKS